MTTDENGGVTLPAGYDGIDGAIVFFVHVSTQCFSTNISAFILINSA
jgi:hypothetical protein